MQFSIDMLPHIEEASESQKPLKPGTVFGESRIFMFTIHLGSSQAYTMCICWRHAGLHGPLLHSSLLVWSLFGESLACSCFFPCFQYLPY